MLLIDTTYLVIKRRFNDHFQVELQKKLQNNYMKMPIFTPF